MKLVRGLPSRGGGWEVTGYGGWGGWGGGEGGEGEKEEE